MRIAIQAVISDIEGQDTRTKGIGVLEYDAKSVPASGLGLFIGETHQLLRQLQTVVLREQVARFLERTSRCRQCGSRLEVKDTKPIVCRTVYGKVRLDSPRLSQPAGVAAPTPPWHAASARWPMRCGKRTHPQ